MVILFLGIFYPVATDMLPSWLTTLQTSYWDCSKLWEQLEKLVKDAYAGIQKLTSAAGSYTAQAGPSAA